MRDDLDAKLARFHVLFCEGILKRAVQTADENQGSVSAELALAHAARTLVAAWEQDEETVDAA